MGRPKGSKNAPKATTPDDPSGLRAAGKKLAEDAAAKAQSKLVLDARDIAITREERELPHALAETEVKHIAAACAQLQGEIDVHEAEKARLQKQIGEKNKTIAALHKDLSKGSAEVRTGTKLLLVGVRVEHDYQAAQLRFYRLDRGPRDVGELYDTTAMPPEERERAIFTAPKDAERVVVEDDETQPPATDARIEPSIVDEPAVNAKGGES
jgi:hypothetical protein